MQQSFSAAIADKPLRPFQWLVMGAALIVLVIEGIDLQSLPLLAPEILREWGLDREEFGLALTAALAGMAIGSFFGGWLGDKWGRLKALYLATLIFGLRQSGLLVGSFHWVIRVIHLLLGVLAVGVGQASVGR